MRKEIAITSLFVYIGSMMKKLLTTTILLIAVFSIVMAAPSNTPNGSFSGLKATDYDGNSVDAGIFSEHDVTMINIFTTWCTYCIEEMNDLKKVRDNMPQGTNLIAICADAYENPDDLKAIMDHFNLNFKVLKMDLANLLKHYKVNGFPTTVYVDKTGKVIGAVNGAPKSPYNYYISYTKQMLTATGK